MPVYEYRCPGGHLFNMQRPFEDSDKTAQCPECGRTAQRKLSLFNFAVGWTLSEKSYERGQPQELVRNV